MATDRIAVTIDEDLLAELRTRVGPGGVSAFVVEAARAKLQRDPVLGVLDQLIGSTPVLNQLQQTSPSSSTPAP